MTQNFLDLWWVFLHTYSNFPSWLVNHYRPLKLYLLECEQTNLLLHPKFSKNPELRRNKNKKLLSHFHLDHSILQTWRNVLVQSVGRIFATCNIHLVSKISDWQQSYWIRIWHWLPISTCKILQYVCFCFKQGLSGICIYIFMPNAIWRKTQSLRRSTSTRNWLRRVLTGSSARR